MPLSKSQYIRGLQCHKSLWLYKNKPELRNEPDEKAKSLFKTGNIVGDYAKQLFPGGVEIEFTPNDFDLMIQRTSELIDEGVHVIYEASFKQKDVFVMADILVKNRSGWDIYEVKASTTTKEYHINDAAVQYYTLSSAIEINKVFVVHINNQYERQGELDIDALFTIDDVTKKILEKQTDIPFNLEKIESMLNADMPVIDIGAHCFDPHKCDFKEHCWEHVPNVSVFDLYLMKWADKFSLYNKGIVKLEDLPEEYSLTKTQKVQLRASTSNKTHINKEVIKEFLSTIEAPISFFDFETFQDAVPRFDGQRPFMQIPFQYSLHILNENNELTHIEFLGDESTDPRRALSLRMLEDLPESGSIVAFNQSFEKARIKELAKLYPDLHDDLIKLTDRFVDLIVPFTRLGYYHPMFNGSFSIKSVLPALFPDDPELDYKKLDIQNGGMASAVYDSLQALDNENDKEKIRSQLLAYCYLDTKAMVKIWEKLCASI